MSKLTFDERLDQALAQENETWSQANIRKEIFIAFPEHEKIPWLAGIAINIIRMYGGVFRVGFHDKE